jgi:rhomboid protease GluP
LTQNGYNSDNNDQNTPPKQEPYFSSQAPGQRVLASAPQVQPMVTYVILALTILVFALQLLSQQLTGVDWPALYGSKVNSLIEAGQYWRLFTPMLLHGSILHIGFNMYALYVLGPGLERYYGHWRFLALYLVSGFAGNVFSFIFTESPSLGSSTAIFGLLAAQGMFFFQNRRMLGSVSQRALMNILMLAAVNFFIGLSPGIDNWGHLGGFLAGGMFAFVAGPLIGLRESGLTYELYDQRSASDGLVALAIVGGFNAILVIMTIYMR